MEVVEFIRTPKGTKGPPTPPDNDQEFMDTEDDNNPLVSDLVTLVNIPIVLYFPSWAEG